ncbi:SUMF1/EgtB/PvdO family nonheme iron enzyme [bacterium]|nr:SUMF1/EgtB/PvdO family nonheme iron enzyme [bacterium]
MSSVKKLSILICLFIATAIQAELREMQYEEVPTTVVLDNSFIDKGVLIVASPIPKLSFKSTRGIKSGAVYEKEPGIWWVELEPGVNTIDIYADGYLPFENIQHNFRKRQVWKIKLSPKNPIQDELPVVVRVEPEGASVKIDGRITDVSNNLKLTSGDHDIEISKSGYVSIREEIAVSVDNIFFEYTLEKPKLCIVEVVTDPPGAEVSIDGVKLNGITPISDFYNSGTYPIKITKDKYLPVEKTIVIDQTKQKNSFSYTLEANTGTIIISSTPEVNMEVSLNGNSVGKTPLTLKEQDVGDYAVTANHEFYIAEKLEFPLQRGETYRATLKAEENFAILTVNTTPGANVYLNNQRLSELENLRLHPQTARLRAEKPKCETVETTLILKRGARESVDLYLDEQTGTIAISVDPADAKIELKGDAGERFSSTGTHIFESIPVGSYDLEVSSKGYKAEKRALRLRAGQTLQERVVLEEGMGSDGLLPGMVFVDIPTGSFMMGSPSNEKDRDNDETQHRVTISKSFQMMTTEVTQSMWVSVMGSNPSYFKGDNLPVERVSWTDCQEFIKKLNQRDPGKGYRLPTEAEWEYACRAGTTTRFNTGDSDSDLALTGWYSGNSGSKTHPVGQKEPNAWGLYDMHGNVWEWCSDWKGDYPSGSVTDPTGPSGPSSGTYRVLRGGSWWLFGGICRSADRIGSGPSARSYIYGLRIVRSSL